MWCKGVDRVGKTVMATEEVGGSEDVHISYAGARGRQRRNREQWQENQTIAFRETYPSCDHWRKLDGVSILSILRPVNCRLPGAESRGRYVCVRRAGRDAVKKASRDEMFVVVDIVVALPRSPSYCRLTRQQSAPPLTPASQTATQKTKRRCWVEDAKVK